MQLSHQHLFIAALLLFFSVFLFQLCFFNLAKAAGLQVGKRTDPPWKSPSLMVSASWDVIGPIRTSLKADIKPLQDKTNADTVPAMLQKFQFYRNWTRVGVVASRCACGIYLTDLWNVYVSGNCFFIVALDQLEMHCHRLLRGSPEFAFCLILSPHVVAPCRRAVRGTEARLQAHLW